MGAKKMYRVVLVDDEPLVLVDLKASIPWEPDFALIGEFTRPAEAIEYALAQQPDVVFTDIKMPKVTGLQLMERLRETGLDCLFVVVSGYGDFSYAQQAMRQGAVDYCLKPVSPQALGPLMARLGRLLSAKGLPRALPCQGESTLEKVLRYIEAHLDQPITLDEVARQFYINKSYLCALFKKHQHTTFSLYVAEQKVGRSIQLMRDSGASLEAIALAVGYRDYYYFSRVFKRIAACSPREYQKRCRGQAQ
jgi:two-component system response regulator YesN